VPGGRSRLRLSRTIAIAERGRALEPWYHTAKTALLGPMKFWFNWHLEGLEKVPPQGQPVIVAGNHVSYLDAFAHGYFVVKAGRRPRFLGKAELFDNWFTGMVLRGAGQIPVRRGTGDQGPLDAATRALAAGEVVVIYPEGTVTKNADFSPMRAKTGVVRLALASGAPVLPVATWGGQAVWQKSGKGSLRFGRPIWLAAGDPIDLASQLRGEPGIEELRRLTEVVMGELAVLVESMRSRYPKRWTQAG
jgi:1-acyl-sn-glycerol-3-phosphate acyltransferase